MSTLKEMAHEYKIAAAKLAMSIARHKKLGDMELAELRSMQQSLKDTREIGHLLSGYYDVPREDTGFTMQGMSIRRIQDDN